MLSGWPLPSIVPLLSSVPPMAKEPLIDVVPPFV